ncbi:FAD-dependent oxidoreductase [Paracoccus xiamenensis]|uniref:FAD-dependent oxidoreductase n=1 Tax=Paracoccus xiamenensis TaxID=2714901 RepID=UPI00140E0158|nr:FAD-dependent oxidoreductase [Paracoccus xiamenensis]NHF74453.1 FAD-dependent oxidoreductase [Paracoccus xiamenensis]
MRETTLPESCDLLVVGSGAAGMTAAITAAKRGLRPVIVEKSEYFGGSTAVSGGAIWIPANPMMLAAGMKDDPAAARRYIAHESGNRFRGDLVDAFLNEGPEAISFLHENTALQFTHRAFSPDYHPEEDGAAEGGRVLDALDYDGRGLGDDLADLRPPIPEFTILGGMQLSRPDIYHFLRMTRSAKSAIFAARSILRYGWDRATLGRSGRLVLGAAVAGRLAQTVFDMKIPLLLRHELLSLEADDDGRVTGAKLQTPDGSKRVQSRHGVVLASGGFAQNADRRAEVFPHVQQGLPHYSMTPGPNTGGGIAAAEAVGAAFVPTNSNAAFWAPVSLLPQADGGVRPFPHLFLDRAKPGVIAVGHDGKRFVNEAVSYHDFVQGLIAKMQAEGRKSAWLVADHRALRRYGLGAVPAFPGAYRKHLASGYLKQGQTPEALAASCGIDATAFAQTVASFNTDAQAGSDKAFGKGATSYQTYLGDAENKPNPCLRPLEGRLYAIEIYPGDIGTSMGLDIDANGRVRRGDGSVIAGLYACGNDINSIMAGAYPGAGITLGPALTFGYIVGKAASEAAISPG